MAKLVEVCESLGYHDVWTHANSGNVVFDTAEARPSIERSMTGALEDAFGFEVTTFVRSAAELRKALDAHPFPVGTGDTYFITFLRTPPSAASNDFDTLVVKGRDVHWRMRGKSTDTTVPRATWGVVGEHGSTSRNVTLLERLSAKIAAG